MNQADSLTNQEIVASVNDPIHLLIIFSIMIIAGVLGGGAAYMIEKYTSSTMNNTLKPEFYILIGVCASLLVPLFMTTISSDLLENSRKNHLDYFVFAGFCLIAAISAHRFITSISEKILKQFEDTTQKIETAGMKLQSNENRQELDKEINTLRDNLEHEQFFYFTKERADSILMKILSLSNEGEKTHYFSELIKHYFSASKFDQINAIVDEYSNKINLNELTWANVAIANMNLYSRTQNKDYRKKSVYALQKSIELNEFYGEPYAIHIYLNLIDFASVETDEEREAISNTIGGLIGEIKKKGVETAYDAYTYFLANDGNTFKVYNEILRNRFAEDFKNLEELAIGSNLGKQNNPSLA
ncbi:YEATS-associated helix-containing protein [Rhodohalobacter sulfatireducens]|uniref:YEATS-Like-Associating Three TM domain-containing protein n=1 Tax=Rhodohalobacter sulfatireducens TaxID=2911366 RepID=A0ABS9KB32_9BACT|nr:YEATS-associated helix-containing protein [Rhodohalobacter sulfatireducens]MCG2588037.1 hypothetical protein [Rhodohalobacter sulfatireducens]